MVPRDYQRGRVYAWEERVVAPRDSTRVAFLQGQGMVNAIWREMGLSFPPKVARLPPGTRRVIAHGSRLAIGLGAEIPSWCLLHELAHAMSMTVDGEGDGHGPIFMGLYVGLLERYLRLPVAALLRSLAEAGIDARLDAQPAFLDPGPMEN